MKGNPDVPSGVLVVDKPAGVTSHQVVGRVRRLMGTRKVGHAGTLDPMATGVLVVGVNRATRLLGHLSLQDKDYTATMKLGVSTVTDDAEGDSTGAIDASGIDDEAIIAAMARQTGEIQQVPTAVSAIKINGQRAYAKVRAGEDVVLQPRAVTVSRFEATEIRRHGEVIDVDVEVTCSSGTYVRALARDVGADLGVGGHLTALRRTRIGSFDLTAACPDIFADDAVAPTPMTMAEAAGLSFPVVEVTDDQKAAIRVGRRLDLTVPADVTAMVARTGEMLALYRPDGEKKERSRAICVLV
ncbi:tRNA pseudouridine(55) synthase TruB [Cutibacterium avidum]|uniref:tRNA pseudouridine(55) synthase TruB n=1 Tax=Cutibacterium avidum TaxID=33010 RepID=UPI0008F5D5E7|nr:tRNA pseudouridine(55) synthase TruB [Cutibacterium avidum]MDK7699056.1 tRNA pseudouridine(55) synthase TruB [Cutibacterium avidum]OIJ75709.1 pseudouridine synthase [Cutibacterium avidum]